MESEYIHQLKLYIERVLGRRILSSGDCRFLFHQITQQLNLTLSFNTLRRFFNLMDTKHAQSVYTLNILSAYCGFASFDDFVSTVKRTPIKQKEQQNTDLLFYVVTLFKETEVSDENDYTFFYFVRHTITFLEFHPILIDQFQREIAKTANGQLYYFEQFIHVDRLNGFYGDGLKYYLYEKKNPEAQIFGNYLLCLRYWLTRENKNMEKHYQAVVRHNLNKNDPPATVARYYATQLMQAAVAGTDPVPIHIKARQFYATVALALDNYVSVFRFYGSMAHILMLTGQYEEALFYIDEFLKYKKKYVLPPAESNLAEAIHLFKSISLIRLGQKATGKEWLDSLNPCDFFFLSKQYLSILYLSVKQSLKKSRSEQKQIQSLVKSTGFVRLLEL